GHEGHRLLAVHERTGGWRLRTRTVGGADQAASEPVRMNRDPLGRWRLPLAFGVMIALVILGFLLLLGRGSVTIDVPEVARILFGGEASREVHRTIIMDARLPKAITAVVAGAALAVGGAQM